MRARLSTIDQALVDKIGAASEVRCREAALAVAERAVEAAPSPDPRLERARGALARGEYGASSAREDVERLVEELDEEAWRLQDEAEQQGGGMEEYLACFSRARAAAAVWFGLGEDATTAALEAAYEAQAAIGDAGPVVAVIAHMDASSSVDA
jgi:hypothetical protein